MQLARASNFESTMTYEMNEIKKAYMSLVQQYPTVFFKLDGHALGS